MTAEIKFAGTHSRADLTKAMVLHARLSPVARVLFLLMPFIATAGTALLALTGDLSLVPSLLIMLAFIVVARLGVPRLMAARTWRTSTIHAEPIEGSASEDAVEIRRPSTQSRLPWDKIVKHKLSSDVALLYVSPYDFGICGRRLFHSDQEWAAFSDLVRRHSPPARSGAGQVFLLLGLLAACALLLSLWFFAGQS